MVATEINLWRSYLLVKSQRSPVRHGARWRSQTLSSAAAPAHGSWSDKTSHAGSVIMGKENPKESLNKSLGLISKLHVLGRNKEFLKYHLQ